MQSYRRVARICLAILICLYPAAKLQGQQVPVRTSTPHSMSILPVMW